MSGEEDIKTMKLYSHVDRVYNELKEVGIKPGDPIDVKVLNKFDHYHYYGTKAIEEGIKAMAIKSSDTVLDLGSGLGGAARYMANKCHCHVLALELQDDVHETARDLTQRCGLQDNVRHIHGDFLKQGHGIDNGTIDCIVSWLVFLHIRDKEALFKGCAKALKSGGKIYIEDFFLINKHTTERENELLYKEVFIERLDTRDEYIKHLEDGGFTNVQFTDITASWKTFVKDRRDQYIADRERHIRVHNEQIYNEQLRFYNAVNEIFTGGNLGGCRVTAVVK